MRDALMEAIVAQPDDDAPRLVWADREGGERGELVVIQCRLARHEVPRDERRRLAARETELLEKNARAWSGYAGAQFVRGFVEGLTISVDALVPDVERVFASAPLLRDLRFEPLGQADPIKGETVDAVWAASEANLRGILGRLPPGRIRALSISSSIEMLPGPFDELSNTSWGNYHHNDALLELLIHAPSLSGLRELVITQGVVEPHHIPLLARFTMLERLHLAESRLNGVALVRLLREVPTIERLVPWSCSPRLNGIELHYFLAAPEAARLKELDLMHNDLGLADTRQIADSTALSRLERLGLGWCHPEGVRLLAKSPHFSKLRELDLFGVKNAPALLEGATFTESLRVIRARAADEEALYAMFPALERVLTAKK